MTIFFNFRNIYHPNTTKRPVSGACKLCLRVTPYENREQSVLHRTNKQNKAQCTGLKTKSVLYRTNQQNNALCTGPISKTKRSVPDQSAKQSVVYRTNNQSKTSCTGPISKTKRPIPDHETKQSILYRTNNQNKKRQFLAMVTYGSKVGNLEFLSLGTGSSLQW